MFNIGTEHDEDATPRQGLDDSFTSGDVPFVNVAQTAAQQNSGTVNFAGPFNCAYADCKFSCATIYGFTR